MSVHKQGGSGVTVKTLGDYVGDGADVTRTETLVGYVKQQVEGVNAADCPLSHNTLRREGRMFCLTSGMGSLVRVWCEYL